MIQVRDLHFSYSVEEILGGISFDLMAGEVLGILGPNGVGKTTLLKILAGLLLPTKGSILLQGKDRAALSKKELSRLIAFVPQMEEIFLPFSVEQLVSMGRAPYVGLLGLEGKRDLQAIREVMEITETFSLRNKSVQELSGGERQRVILARALAQEASLLLLDEPTSHLDIRFQMEFLELCHSLNRTRGITVVMTLHDINLAALYCHRIALLKCGAFYAIGAPSEVITEKTIQEVYGTQVSLLTHPKSRVPSILPVRLQE